MKLLPNLRGDFFGALSAAATALPLAMAFGIAAFAPLGPEYVAQGALAGLYGAIVSAALASIFGGTPSQVSGPTAAMAVLVTSVIADFTMDPELVMLGASRIEVVLLLTAAVIFWGGLLQILVGMVGGAKLVKYIPSPVITGFMNGIAILLFVAQLKPFLGVTSKSSLAGLFSGTAALHTDTVIVGAVTIIAALAATRIMKNAPAVFVGLLAGIAAYVLLGKTSSPELLRLEGNGKIIGPLGAGLPSPKEVGVFFAWVGELPMRKWLSLIFPAVSLGILASIDTLLTSVTADVSARTKHKSNRELVGQGIGNIASAAFGALPIAGSRAVTAANITSGGRTPLAALLSSAGVLLVLLLLAPLLQWIPLAALAGLLMVTAIRMVDYESLNLFKMKSGFENLMIILTVTAVTISIDLMIAVAVGLIVASFLFVKEQSDRTIVRRKYFGHVVHSKKFRSREHTRILEEKGKQIVIYELSGSLFFGTCDKLMSEIEKDFKRLCVILDFKRVSSIDLTSAQLLRQMVDRVQDEGHHLLISYLGAPGDEEKKRLRTFLEETGVIRAVGADHVFFDTDYALEWAEEALITRELAEARQAQEAVVLKNLSLFRDLTPKQLSIVENYLHPVSFKKGELVFKEGDPGDKIYFILSGIVSVIAGFTENGRVRRLTTFAEGLFFGDMAILEERPRSASVQAETDAELLYMHKDDFRTLTEDEPLIASRMLLAMSRELAYRLRLANAEVSALSA